MAPRPNTRHRAEGRFSEMPSSLSPADDAWGPRADYGKRLSQIHPSQGKAVLSPWWGPARPAPVSQKLHTTPPCSPHQGSLGTGKKTQAALPTPLGDLSTVPACGGLQGDFHGPTTPGTIATGPETWPAMLLQPWHVYEDHQASPAEHLCQTGNFHGRRPARSLLLRGLDLTSQGQDRPGPIVQPYTWGH